MTREEILRKYTPLEKKTSWIMMGSNTISSATKVYNEGSLYRLEAYSNYQDALIYCRKNCSGNFDWRNVYLINEDTGELTFGNDVISAQFTLVMTPEQFNAVDDEDVDRFIQTGTFLPFSEEAAEGEVHISEEDYALCLKCLGYPFISESELEYTRSQITSLAIKPALQRYFKYFPKTIIKTYPIVPGTQGDEVFPDGAYDIIHFSLQQAGQGMNGASIGNPLLYYWSETVPNAMSSGYGTYANSGKSTLTNSSGLDVYLNGRALRQALTNYGRRVHVRKERMEDGKYHALFTSTTAGTAEIHYAVQTLDFNDVELARRPEVLKLCEAEIKLLFGNLRRQIKGDIPAMYDYSKWVEEANQTIKDVEENFQNIVKYSSVIRGGL